MAPGTAGPRNRSGWDMSETDKPGAERPVPPAQAAQTAAEKRPAPRPPAPDGRPARPPIAIKQQHSTFEVALVSVQALTAAVTMVIALVGAVYVQDEYHDRRQARMTRAWTLLYNTREELFHNVGQVEALQSLHESGANLREIDMSTRYLQGIVLNGASLYRATFQSSKMMEADLQGADLRQSSLSRTNLTRADLSGADLTDALLTGTNLTGARLARARLGGALLSGATLSGADLTGVRGLTADQIGETCADPADPPALPNGLPLPPAC